MTAEVAFADGKMLAQKADGVGTMTFNNPEKRNAVSFDMWKAAGEILADFAADPAIRVVVVTGAGGKAFVSGADVSKFDDERSEAEAVQRYNAATEAIYSGLHRFPKPTIAKIRGAALPCEIAIPKPPAGESLDYEKVNLALTSKGQTTELANGISEALNCTAFGIGTSLIGLLGFSLLQGKTTHVIDDINEVTVQVVNLVTSHRAQMQPTG